MAWALTISPEEKPAIVMLEQEDGEIAPAIFPQEERVPFRAAFP
jgi:hypothetical protein